MAKNELIRPSSLAGRWYPADPAELSNLLEGFLDNVQLPPIQGEISGLIAPHAGYVYSGQTAAYAYKAIQNLTPEIIIIFSPLHAPANSAVFTTSHCHYQTPLGQTPVGLDLITSVKDSLDQKEIRMVSLSNDSEHSIEIQLPFLHTIYQHDFKVVPIMLRTLSVKMIKTLSEVIHKCLGQQSYLLIASTDLSHFHSAIQAYEMDKTMIGSFHSMDPELVLNTARSGKGAACGVGAVAATIALNNLIGPSTLTDLKYSHSGEVSGDFDSVVGYYSGVIFQPND